MDVDACYARRYLSKGALSATAVVDITSAGPTGFRPACVLASRACLKSMNQAATRCTNFLPVLPSEEPFLFQLLAGFRGSNLVSFHPAPGVPISWRGG